MSRVALMLLADGETFSSASGCAIVVVDDNDPDVLDAQDGGDPPPESSHKLAIEFGMDKTGLWLIPPHDGEPILILTTDQIEGK